MKWQPISEFGDYYSRDFSNIVFSAPELVDADFNEKGVANAYYSDDRDFPWDPAKRIEGADYGGWIGVGWDSCNDIPVPVKITPSHFMVLDDPPIIWTQEEADAAREIFLGGSSVGC